MKADISILTTAENYEEPAKVPRSDRSEVALLSAMMLQPSSAKAAIAYGIQELDFFDERHKACFKMLRDLMESGKPLDYVLVLNECINYPPLTDLYLAQVYDFCASGANWKYYCEILREKTIGRNMIKAAQRLRDIGTGSIVDKEECLRELRAVENQCSPIITSDEDIDDFADYLENDIPVECFSVGIPEIDYELKGGIHRGELVVFGGYTKAGKSMLLGMMALEAIKLNKRVAYVTLEMPPNDIKRRIGSNYTNVSIKPRSEHPTPKEMEAGAQAISFLRDHPIHFFGSHSSMRSIEDLCQNREYDLIIVDYLQLVDIDEGDNREQQVSAVAKRMKNITRSLNVTVATATQLNDDGQARESRAITHAADQYITIDNGSKALRVVANRRGQSGSKVDVTLRGDLGRFEQA